jgi:hypothetical protein
LLTFQSYFWVKNVKKAATRLFGRRGLSVRDSCRDGAERHSVKVALTTVIYLSDALLGMVPNGC